MSITRYHPGDIGTLYSQVDLTYTGKPSESRTFFWLVAEGEGRESSFLWPRKKQVQVVNCLPSLCGRDLSASSKS